MFVFFFLCVCARVRRGGGDHWNVVASSFVRATCVKVISIREQMIHEDEQ